MNDSVAPVGPRTVSTPAIGIEEERLFESALSKIVFLDRGARVRLCVADLALANLAHSLVLEPAVSGAGKLVRVEIPRGANEIAVAFAIEAQLGRLRALQSPERLAKRRCIEGSVIVIGTDTAVHARLREISVERVPLDSGLSVHRIRGDGRVVAQNGDALTFQPGRHELLYLNTRVGWPNLPAEHDGLVVIDRTSFGTMELLDTAIAWARRQKARHIVVLHNHGDREARKVADLRWTMDRLTLSALDQPVALSPVQPGFESGLSLGPLLAGLRPTLSVARVSDPIIEDLSASIHGHIAAARRIADRVPYPLFAAARLLTLGNSLVGAVKRYDQSAALMPRLKPLSDLRRAVEDGHDRLDGIWAGYRETRYGALRADVGRYFTAIEHENPKFEALLFLLDDLRRRPVCKNIVVRVADEAAILALEEEVLEFEPRLAEGVHFVSGRQCLPWDTVGVVEVLSGLPAPWRRDALWSGEARERIVLSYGWEAAVLQADLNAEVQRTRAQLPARFAPSASSTTSLVPGPVPIVFEHKRRANDNLPAPREFQIELADIVGDVEPEIELRAGDVVSQRAGTSGWPISVRIVSLEPNGAAWLVPVDAEVDVLVGLKFRRLPATSLAVGSEVIVPRGSGRESLFSRALAVIEGQGAYVDVEFILGRWRRACRTVLEIAGSTVRACEMLREEGATTVTQIEAWADGSTLAPNDHEDLARVARLAKDDWLTRNWKRVAALVRQVRGTHISLGHAISGAMREAAGGHGPNLERLADLLGVDAASILDEFDLRIVRSVSAPVTVPASLAGSVLAPG